MVEAKPGTFASAVRHKSPLKAPVMVALDAGILGAVPPHPDLGDQTSTRAGAVYRAARKPPSAVKDVRERFRKFVMRWLFKHLRPLTDEPTFDSWLEECPYTLTRKAQLRKEWEACEASGGIWSKRAYTACKCFAKAENYAEYKYQRGINSRHDSYKCYSGPFFKAIERVLFALPYFIKKVPVRDRPQYILDNVAAPGSRYMATDYTAFESLFTKSLMEDCEMLLYWYMTKELASGRKWFRTIHTVQTGTNMLKYKHFWMKVEATRMSGEMCTSLGNSFTNLMAALFILELTGTPDAKGVVEGDDGLFRVRGRMPTKEDFATLGLNIKIEEHNNVEEASFCGLIFDELDRANVTDPRDVLANFGWTTAKYLHASAKTRKMLLRAKSLSLLYQYPGCPIVQAAALYGLRHTEDVDNKAAIRRAMRNANQYEIGMYLEMLKAKFYSVDIGMGTRLLVERRYNITVAEQLAIEASFVTAPLGWHKCQLNYHWSWMDYWNKYVDRSEVQFGKIIKFVDRSGPLHEDWKVPPNAVVGLDDTWEVPPDEPVGEESFERRAHRLLRQAALAA